MKKAQTLEFLFYAILALIIFIPTALWASQFIKLGDKSVESYNNLVGIVNKLEPGDLNSLAFYMDSDNIVFGISNGTIKVESIITSSSKIETIAGTFTPPSIIDSSLSINRPGQCPLDKSCICICQDDIELEGFTDQVIKCGGKIFCSQHNNIQFFEERQFDAIPIKTGAITFDGMVKNGFFLTMEYSTVYGVSTRLDIQSPTTVYVERYENYVNVCFTRKCITNDMKDELNKGVAIKEFNRFKEFYFECKQTGTCGTFSLTLPDRYSIYYNKIKDSILNLKKPGKLVLINTDNTDIDYIRENLGEVVVKDKTENEISFEGTLNNFEGKIYTEGIFAAVFESVAGLLDNSFELKKVDDKVVIKK